MKKCFEEPNVNVGEFAVEDVITTSITGGQAGGNVGGGGQDD